MKEARKYMREQLNDSSKIMGLLFGLVVFVIFVSGFFSNYRLGTIDTGKYQWVMGTVGLSYTQKDLKEPETLTYDRVIENYNYGSFYYEKLLSPSGTTSLIYPIALIRLVTKPFGISFSVRYLYLFYGLLTAYGVYMLVHSCAYLAGKWAVIPGGCFILLFSDANLTAYYSSLYFTGTVIVSLVLMTGAALRIFSYGKNRGFSVILRFLLSVAFCLNSSELSFLFIPFAVVLAGFALWKDRKTYRQRKGLVGGTIFFLLISIYSSFYYSFSSVDLHSNAAKYHSAFLGFLQNTKNPEKDLAEFGLDESYAQDIGKSYYQPEEDYVHNPRDPKEANVLFQKLNERSIASWYWHHPSRILMTVMGQKEAFNHLETDRTLMVGSSTSEPHNVSHVWSIADSIIKIILPSNYYAMNIIFGLASVVMLLMLIILVKKRLASFTGYVVCAWLWLAGGFALILAHVFFQGSDSLELIRVVSVFFLVLSLSLIGMVCGVICEQLSVWFRRTQETSTDENIWLEWRLLEEKHGKLTICFEEMRQKLKNMALKIALSRGYTAIAILILALSMSGIIQFTGTRAGCVNNGDYGRMMEQLGLTWQGDLFYDTEAQVERGVIEQYAYRNTFDWTTLTVLNPKYSLIYPATVIRGVCSIIKQPFSTWYMSILMNFILIICIVSIVKDLYLVFHRFTLALGMGICLIFLSESYIVWFNSLFGEGSILLGFFMLLACSIHLAVIPKGKGALQVFLLIFCGRFLTCAKAQMLTVLPIVLFLIIVFALYHRPLHLRKLIPYTFMVMIGCALISYETIKIYQDNGSISERQTTWASVFYGALMISDDPLRDMKDLGIDVRMKPDIGKHAYYPDEDYVISPNTEEADEAFYNHVNTFTMVKYYLKHPLLFLKMLNYAAGESREMYNDFRVYLGQDYKSVHDPVQRFGFWLYWRKFFTFGSFWMYVLVYGGILYWGIAKVLIKSDVDIRRKLLVCIYLCVMLIGSIQYPLSVVGNGFADNHKQMFGFMLCHDFLVIVGIPFVVKNLEAFFKRENNKKNNASFWHIQ